MAEEIKSNKSMKFDKIQIKLASPESILEWSHGEVTKPETINTELKARKRWSVL